MPPTRPRRDLRRAAALSLGLAFAASVAACGSSDATSGAGATSSADTTSTFCDTFLKVDQRTTDADTSTPEGANKLAVEIGPEVKTLQANTPDALTKQTARLAGAVEAAKRRKAGAFENDAFLGAVNQAEAWLHEHCGYQQIELTAVDYRFNGLPATLKAGRSSIALQNDSQMGEMHLALLLKLKKGATESLDELLALPEDQVDRKVDTVGAAFVPPGQTGGALVDLTPGTYYVVCPLPVGGKDDGAPHFTKGMSATFRVS